MNFSAAGIAGVAIVVAIAIVVLAAIDAVITAAIVVGEIMYPDYHNSDNHDDPEGLISLEQTKTFAIIARIHKKLLPPK